MSARRRLAAWTTARRAVVLNDRFSARPSSSLVVDSDDTRLSCRTWRGQPLEYLSYVKKVPRKVHLSLLYTHNFYDGKERIVKNTVTSEF